MESVQPKLVFSPAFTAENPLPVIVVAAGASTRMGGINKQLILLSGKPVIEHTLSAFDRSPFISRIILVTRETDIPEMQRLCDEWKIGKLTDIVPGGADRHASVLCGMERLTAAESKVLIHDGARPLVNDFLIGNVVSALETADAALCAIPIHDTVKRVDGNGRVTETVDRSGLYAAQTPQGVDVVKYRLASENADEPFTDDASVMERAGHTVTVVAGEPKNIKITSPADIALAERYLKEEA